MRPASEARGDRHIHPQTRAKGATENRLNRGAKVCVPGVAQVRVIGGLLQALPVDPFSNVGDNMALQAQGLGFKGVDAT